jgi:hypothetical protein
MIITISQLEYQWAAYAGILRNKESTEAGRQSAYRITDKAENLHILGAVGEFIASLAIGVPWRGPGSLRGDDLVGGYQVRSTERLNGSLILRRKDSDDAIFILVAGGPLKWIVPGWILGRDGKQKEFRGDPTGKGRPSAYFVPQLALKPIKDLKM